MWHVMEFIPGVQYEQLLSTIKSVLPTDDSKAGPDKEHLESLLSLAENRREKEIVAVTFCKAAAISARKARNFGFSNMSSQMKAADDASITMQIIRDCVGDLAEIEKTALLHSLGYEEHQDGRYQEQ